MARHRMLTGLVAVRTTDASPRDRFYKRDGRNVMLSASAGVIVSDNTTQAPSGQPEVSVLAPASLLWPLLEPKAQHAISMILQQQPKDSTPTFLSPSGDSPAHGKQSTPANSMHISLHLPLASPPPTQTDPASQDLDSGEEPDGLLPVACYLQGFLIIPAAAAALTGMLEDVRSAAGTTNWGFAWGLGSIGEPSRAPHAHVRLGSLLSSALGVQPAQPLPANISACIALLQPVVPVPPVLLARALAQQAFQLQPGPLAGQAGGAGAGAGAAATADGMGYTGCQAPACGGGGGGSALSPGQRVLALGSPFGCLAPHHFTNSAMQGVVSMVMDSSVHASAHHLPSCAALFTIDAPCQPGMEGGVVVAADTTTNSGCSRTPLGSLAGINSSTSGGGIQVCGRPVVGLLGLPLSRAADGVQIQVAISWTHVVHAWAAFKSSNKQLAVTTPTGRDVVLGARAGMGLPLCFATNSLAYAAAGEQLHAAAGYRGRPLQLPAAPPDEPRPGWHRGVGVAVGPEAPDEPRPGWKRGLSQQQPGLPQAVPLASLEAQVAPAPASALLSPCRSRASPRARVGRLALARRLPPLPPPPALAAGGAVGGSVTGAGRPLARTGAGGPRGGCMGVGRPQGLAGAAGLGGGGMGVGRQPTHASAVVGAAAEAVAAAVGPHALPSAMQAVVLVRTVHSWATGVVVTPGGLLITNAHLLLPAAAPAARSVSHRHPARATTSAGSSDITTSEGGSDAATCGTASSGAASTTGSTTCGGSSAAGTTGSTSCGGSSSGGAVAGDLDGPTSPMLSRSKCSATCMVRVSKPGQQGRWVAAHVLYVFSNHLDLAVLQLQLAPDPPPATQHTWCHLQLPAPLNPASHHCSGAAAAATTAQLTACGASGALLSAAGQLPAQPSLPLAGVRVSPASQQVQPPGSSVTYSADCAAALTPEATNSPAGYNGPAGAVVDAGVCGGEAITSPAGCNGPSGQAAEVAMMAADSCRFGTQEVFVVGHGLVGPAAGWPPAVTGGNIAQVVHAGGQPCMLITTATVHAGASGGAVLDGQGEHLLGLVTSNARHASGSTLPTLNFCIPAHALAPVIAALTRYEARRDPHLPLPGHHSSGYDWTRSLEAVFDVTASRAALRDDLDALNCTDVVADRVWNLEAPAGRTPWLPLSRL